MNAITAVVIVALHYFIVSTGAWPMLQQQQHQPCSDILPSLPPPQQLPTVDHNHIHHRRNFLSSMMSATTTVAWMIVAKPSTVHAVAATTNPKVTAAIQELKESRDKLKDIPDLLEAKEWDKVRSILKVPPVNKLWNLGDSQNTVSALAKETGNIDLFELKEDLAYNLQICDQLTYDNAFVYYQPGNGKFKIKEPQQLSVMAMKQIQQIIDIIEQE